MHNDLSDLCNKYSGRLPRYTSYPTAVEFKDVDNTTDVKKHLSEIEESSTISLYVHLPYCPSLCYFCACNKEITDKQDKNRAYLEYLKKEIKLLKSHIPNSCIIKQIHLGGGSPSYLNEEDLKLLEDILCSNFNIDKNCARSIEVDPRSFSDQKAKVLSELNYQRVSLGVQDFDPKVQKLINRIQPYELTKKTHDYVKKYDYKGVNFDLIYGLPSQSRDSFEDTINKVIDLKPDRIALYGYAHVNWKVKVQTVFNKYPLPTPEQRIEMFSMAVNRLQEAGYVYIGLDHFALPSDELTKALNNKTMRRNFMGYTTVYGQYSIGLGASSISDLSETMYQNLTSVDDYMKCVDSGELPVLRSLNRSEDDEIRCFIIERLMCDRYLDVSILKEEFKNNDYAKNVFISGLKDLEQFIDDDFLKLTNDSVSITELGSFFLRNIVSVYDSYLKDTGLEKQFSQSV